MASINENYNRSVQGLRSLKKRIHDSAIGALSASREERSSQIKMDNLQTANPAMSQLGGGDVSAYYVVTIGLLAVYLIDVFLFGPTVEVLVERAFSGSSEMSVLARYLAPAAFIIVEMVAALQIYYSRSAALGAHPTFHNNGYIFWLLLGIATASVLPLLVWSTSHIQTSLAGETEKPGLYIQGIALAVLAFAMHMTILFGGRRAHDAKTYFMYRVRQSSVERSINRNQRRYAECLERVRADFDSYSELYDYHNRTFQERFDSGPWDQNTRNLLHQIYGYEVIRRPGENTDPRNQKQTDSGETPSEEQSADNMHSDQEVRL